MSTAIRIVPISEDRLKDLQKLYHLTFGKRYSVNYIRLKYDTSYTGMQHVAHLAYDGNKPVAFLGAIPMPFLLNTTKLIGVQYCDYMTLPEYRRRGIHSQLLESTTELVSKQGADFIFAMHTINSANGDLRFNWNFQESLNAYVVSLQVPKVLQIANRIQQYTASFKGVGAKGKQSLVDWPKLDLRDVAGVDYSDSFFRYKAFSTSRRINLNNVFHWIKSGVVMEVGNTEAVSEADLKNSFEALIQMARKAGCSKLIVQPRKNTMTDKYLSSLYKSVDGYKPAFHILKRGLNFSGLQLNYCDFDTF